MDDATLCKHLGRAEGRIQAAMLDLEEALIGSEYQADAVNVDTRNFATMKAEILVSKRST